MKSLRSFHLCALSLLFAAGCAEPPRSFMGPYSGALPPDTQRTAVDFYYNLSDCAFGSNLRNACRRCAAVEFRQSRPAFCRRFDRAQLEDALLAIRRIERWYARATPQNMAVGLGHLPQIRFLDAEGQQLFAVLLYPAGDGYARNGADYVSLWRIFDSYLAPGLQAP